MMELSQKQRALQRIYQTSDTKDLWQLMAEDKSAREPDLIKELLAEAEMLGPYDATNASILKKWHGY